MCSFIFASCLLNFNTFFISLQRIQFPLKSLKKQTHSLFTIVQGHKPLFYFYRDRFRKDDA